MISNAFSTLYGASITPYLKANAYREKSIEQSGTWGQALSARALYIAQILTSIVSAPLSMLALIFAPVFASLVFCFEEKKQAVELLTVATLMPFFHVALLPTSLIAAFVPHSLKWEAPGTQVAKCLENCLGDS